MTSAHPRQKGRNDEGAEVPLAVPHAVPPVVCGHRPAAHREAPSRRSGGSPGKLMRPTTCPPQRAQRPNPVGAVRVFSARLSRRPTLASSGRSLAATARLISFGFFFS